MGIELKAGVNMNLSEVLKRFKERIEEITFFWNTSSQTVDTTLEHSRLSADCMFWCPSTNF